MDPELKLYLDEMKRELTAQAGRVETNLLTHVANVEASLRGHVSQESGRVETNLLTHVANVETSLRGHVSQESGKVETKLLTEFHKWASPLEMRVRSHSSILRTLDMDLEALADRVNRLERPGPGAS